MFNIKLPSNLHRTVARTILTTKKYSPEIMTATGVAGMVTGTVLACKQTLKVEEAMMDHMRDLDLVNQGLANPDLDYTEKEAARDKAVIYTRSAVTLLKLYAVPVAVISLSAMSIFGSHKILRGREAQLATMLAASDKAFREYRNRVAKEYGEDTDRAMLHNFEKATVTVKDEDGKDVEKDVLKATNGSRYSQYARFFDETCEKYSRVPMYNRQFVLGVQDHMNNLLHQRGHVFLNEAYDALGLPRSPEGAVVGWVLGNGDNFVDFGLFDVNNEKACDFINGREKSIILDFNCIGNILEYI